MAVDQRKRGFAGLEAMVSEIGDPQPPTQPPSSRTEPSRTPEPKPQQTQPNNPGSSGIGLTFLVVGLVLVVILIANSGSGPAVGPNYGTTQTSDPTPPPIYAPPPAPSLPRPSTSTPTPTNKPAPSYVPESTPGYHTNNEVKPPIGSGLLLDRAQIRYCQSQKIRLSGWEGVANKFSKTAVGAFNAAVDDYNARCSNFRYPSGMLESVRTEIEANRYQLMAEGRVLASTNP
jgi:hypothetical protein